jgi:DNA primase
MPPISKKPPYVIDRGEEYKHRLVVVEGIFDAIAALIQCPDYTPVAVLGSSISDYQIDYLRDYCGYIDKIRVWMDETKISIGIAEKLKKELGYPIIKIIKSNGQDPEEIMKFRMSRGYSLQWIK